MLMPMGFGLPMPPPSVPPPLDVEEFVEDDRLVDIEALVAPDEPLVAPDEPLVDELLREAVPLGVLLEAVWLDDAMRVLLEEALDDDVLEVAPPVA
jgi:hypothetical protein